MRQSRWAAFDREALKFKIDGYSELQTNEPPHASPMTYMVDHKQYVVVASGPSIIAFDLPE